MNQPGLPPPEITEELRARARSTPDSWLYVVDPAVDPTTRVPGWAVQGGFRVDGRGELTGEYRPNPNYRPSPRALRLPKPTNALEDALQRAATGTGSEESLLDAVMDGELIMFAGDAGEAELFVKRDVEGNAVIQAFTSDSVLPEGWSRWQRTTGRKVATVLAGKFLQLNPGSAVSVTIPGDDLAARADKS